MAKESKTKGKKETKTEEIKEIKEPRISLQSLLAVLLLISLLANGYFIIQITDLNKKIFELGGSNLGTTTTLLPVVTTTLGGEIKVVEAGKIVKVDYIGKFENGTIFDTSLEDEAKKAGIYNELKSYEPFSFVAGKGQVIKGFDKAVIGMKVGEEKTVTIPTEEGYSIGPLAGKILIFKIIVRDVKEPKKLSVLVVNDKRCKECNITELMDQLEGVFPGLEYGEIDYSSDEGKRLYNELNLTYLPAILFDESVKEAEGYENVQRFLDPTGKYLSLRIGASFDPTAEICDNGIDDNENGLVDCEDPDCTSELICNKDALVECAEPYNITSDTIIFYHSNQCGWCAKMKPGVQKLQKEGYKFYWAEVSDVKAMEVIEKCFGEYITSGGVPQFICVKNAKIKVGAFTDDNQNLDLEALKKFADDCIAS